MIPLLYLFSDIPHLFTKGNLKYTLLNSSTHEQMSLLTGYTEEREDFTSTPRQLRSGTQLRHTLSWAELHITTLKGRLF